MRSLMVSGVFLFGVAVNAVGQQPKSRATIALLPVIEGPADQKAIIEIRSPAGGSDLILLPANNARLATLYAAMASLEHRKAKLGANTMARVYITTIGADSLIPPVARARLSSYLAQVTAAAPRTIHGYGQLRAIDAEVSIRD